MSLTELEETAATCMYLAGELVGPDRLKRYCWGIWWTLSVTHALSVGAVISVHLVTAYRGSLFWGSHWSIERWQHCVREKTPDTNRESKRALTQVWQNITNQEQQRGGKRGRRAWEPFLSYLQFFCRFAIVSKLTGYIQFQNKGFCCCCFVLLLCLMFVRISDESLTSNSKFKYTTWY
jgi:hypothetical protein